jgi:hypothetical protein
MSGPWLVKLRTIIYADRFELVLTNRNTSECTVIPLDDDELAVVGFEFADALMQRHAHRKRLARQQVPPNAALHDDPPQHIGQHQQAAE